MKRTTIEFEAENKKAGMTWAELKSIVNPEQNGRGHRITRVKVVAGFKQQIQKIIVEVEIP